jgi:hypothetical protein
MRFLTSRKKRLLASSHLSFSAPACIRAPSARRIFKKKIVDFYENLSRKPKFASSRTKYRAFLHETLSACILLRAVFCSSTTVKTDPNVAFPWQKLTFYTYMQINNKRKGRHCYVSTATMVRRTRHDVTLYVNCLSCSIFSFIS